MTAMDKMHVPYFITIPFSVMFRYFPTLGEKYNSIHDAMKMCEIGQSVKNPFTYIEYVLVPIMMSTVRIADELSAASLTKGLCADGSGCGKTTVTRLINGLIPHYYSGTLNGEVLIDGKRVPDSPIFETAKKVGSVFE